MEGIEVAVFFSRRRAVWLISKTLTSYVGGARKFAFQFPQQELIYIYIYSSAHGGSGGAGVECGADSPWVADHRRVSLPIRDPVSAVCVFCTPTPHRLSG